MKDLLIYGAGGFGKEVHDLVGAINMNGPGPEWKLLGFIDADKSLKSSRIYGLEVLGAEEEVLPNVDLAWLAIGIGNGRIRQAIEQRITADYPHIKWATLTHPSVILGSQATIGQGAVVLAGSIISSDAVAGRQLQMNFKSTIGHDAAVGNYVTISNGAVINAECVLGDLCFLGTNAVINPRHRLGENVHVGSNVAVTRNIESNVVLGPALPRRQRVSSRPI